MIAWNFVYEQEGGLILRGYVPEGGTGSGVTLAAGVDLGWMPGAEFSGLPPALQDKLRRYHGVKGLPARLVLRQYPITITRAEADALMTKKKTGFLHDIHARFDRRAPIPFDRIPDGPATAIMDVTWQYGNPWEDPLCGDFWKIATACTWKALEAYLRDFPDKRFISRRRRAADFLAKAVNIYDGKLSAVA